MASVQKSIDVDVPVDTAYNQWTQFESFPNFMEGVQEVRQLDNKRLHWKADIAGTTEEWDAEITEQIPDERVAWKSTNGPQNAGVVTFHHLSPNTCKVSLQLEYTPEGFMQSLGDAMGIVSGQIEGDLQKFKSFIEDRGSETGAWRGSISHGQESPQPVGAMAGTAGTAGAMGTASTTASMNQGNTEYSGMNEPATTHNPTDYPRHETGPGDVTDFESAATNDAEGATGSGAHDFARGIGSTNSETTIEDEEAVTPSSRDTLNKP